MSKKSLAEINQEEYKALLQAIQNDKPFDSNKALLCLLLKSELDEAKITKLEERIEALEYSVKKLECNEINTKVQVKNLPVKKKVKRGATEKAENLEAKIHEACWNDKTNRVIKLLESTNRVIDTKKIDKNGSLYVAVQNGNATVVEGLLKIGCDPNIINSRIEKDMKCPLYLAIEKRNLKILKLLFKHNANANLKHMYGGTPLHYAVGYENGDIQIVKELLDNGADTDAQNRYQITPLIIALESKRIDIAEALLAYGANINYPCNSGGRTVLHDMVFKRDIEIIKFLLENGANVDSASYNKETPLLACLEIDRLDIAECLLKKGANANSPCFESGQTVLHYMITHCRLEQNLT